MGIAFPGGGWPSWVDNRPQTHPMSDLLASPSNGHPRAILPLESVLQGIQSRATDALSPQHPPPPPPPGLLTASSSPNTISGLSLRCFH